MTDAREVMPTVATVLDIAEALDRSALEALCAVIAGRRMLLVLDNLEQVLDAAEDIAKLVARCPELQVIATSRAPLKVSAESEFALPPLELPEQEEHSSDKLRECPSVALFVQRAAKVKSGFALDAANADAIAAICRRLDGLPLALELAAARVRILDPAKLLQRLDHALDLLTSGDRDLPLRQKTLRATISWSYSLLEAPEQQLLRRCSVFHEGWTFEAMEQVCYDEEDRWRALDELESLVEKGLIRVVGDGERYALLETIRAFAAEQLHAGGEVDRIREAHADWFVEWTGEMARDFRLPGQHDAVRAIRADNANELAAIHWVTAAARVGDAEALEKGLLLCGHLDWFWHVWGLHLTARGLVDELLALAQDRGPSRGRGLAYLAAAMVSITTGEIERSLEEWNAGYEDGLALGDEAIAAEGCMGKGYVHMTEGRLEETLTHLDESIARGSAAGDEFIQALSLAIKGLAVFQLGDAEAGMRMTGEAHAIQERLGDGEGGGIALSFLAQMHFVQGDMAQAKAFYKKSLVAFGSAGDRPEIARVHCEMGWTALADHDRAGTRRSFRSSLQMYEEVGSARGSGLALLGLAAVEAAEGHTERAVTIAEAANALATRAGVVCDHPMDPGITERIAELRATIPAREVAGIVADAESLTPAAVLEMVADPD